MKLPRAGLFSFSVFLIIFFILPAVSAKTPEDLKLNTITTRRVIVSPRRNPHDNLQCYECHQELPRSSPAPVAAPEEFLKDEYPDDLCNRCHRQKCDLHPTGVGLTGKEISVTVPEILPLRYVYEGRYKITCMTCHYVHYPHTGFNLLRGYAINPEIQESRFKTRLDFCRSCHGEKTDYLSPHKETRLEAGCGFCHAGVPETGKAPVLKSGVNNLCSYCHPTVPRPHYLEFNPFPDVKKPELTESGLSLTGGKYTCITCHVNHETTSMPSYLRPAYVYLVRGSNRIKPHEKETFCLNCHRDKPPALGTVGAEYNLLNDNVTELCNGCHGSGEISSMSHPLAPLPEGISLPESWPVTSEGDMACNTCHQPGHPPPAPDNPRFLRGGPYEKLNKLCLTCHEEGKWVDRDPHSEYLEDRGCELCHQPGVPQPDGSIKQGPTKADGNFVCLGCHEPVPHPANHRHNVRPGLYEYVTMEPDVFPLDEFGRLTCFSCHDDHQKEPAAFFIRKPYGPRASICGGCHPF